MDTKIVSAARWSVITEVLAKLITPLTNIILAHILEPSAFGILATIMMVISFAEMLADAGFQKFLVQYEFFDDDEKQRSINVAFVCNLIFSLLLWGAIIIWRDQLALIVGNPGLGFPLAIMGGMVPLTAFSSIQMAVYRRSFDFKFLLRIRVITVFTPLFVSIPLAVMYGSYWSLIIGLLLAQLFTALALFMIKKDQLRFKFEWSVFKNMFSFSAWSLAEAFSIWLTAWADTFIISRFLDSYYLGIFKMPVAIVTTMMAMATASLAPVLFAALSRSQGNDTQFGHTFFTFQRYMAMFLVPVGVGLFVFRDFVVNLLLGSQWESAGIVLGSWALSSAIMTVTANLISEIFRAKGLPNLSFWAQILHLIVLVPVIYIFVQHDFETFVYARSIVRTQLLIVMLLLLYIFIKHISIVKVISNIFPYLVSAMITGLLASYALAYYNGTVWTLTIMVSSLLVYFGMIGIRPTDRIVLVAGIQEIKVKLKL